MKREPLKYEILARYLAGEQSSVDEKEINEWLDADVSNKRKLKEFRYIWTSAAIKSDLKQKWSEIDEDWDKLKEQLNQQKAFHDRKPSGLKIISLRRSSQKLKQFLQVAAIVLIVGLCGLFAYKLSSKKLPEKETPAMRIFTTAKGERMNLTLSDGTHIILNAGSQLKLPEKFTSKKREVYLNGEAYFEVEHHSDRPFLVHSGGTTTRDLGTSFVIRSYSGDNQVLLVVAEGRVKFEPNAEQPQNYNIITEKHLLKYDIKQHEMTQKDVRDLSLYLGWTKGYLNFKKELMGNVARHLERRYNVKVLFKDKSIAKMKLTASLKSRNITNVLNVIAKALNIHYSIEKDEVIFTYN